MFLVLVPSILILAWYNYKTNQALMAIALELDAYKKMFKQLEQKLNQGEINE